MNSTKDYFLKSQRLGFATWCEDDFDLAQRLWGDPDVTRFMTKVPLTNEEVTAKLQLEIDNLEKHHIQYWQIFELESGEFVGCCGLRPFNVERYSGRSDASYAEFGFHLLPGKWGRGFATEAGRTVIDYAFSHLHKKVIFAGHHPENRSSRNALLKLGFVGSTAELFKPTGLNHPSYLLYSEELEYSLRAAKQLDAAAIAAVHFRSIGETFSETIPLYVQSRTLDDFENTWKERVESQTCLTQVLLHGEQIVGFVSAGPSRDEDADDKCGSVERIYLHPNVFEKRLGLKLLKWCEENLASRGFTHVQLWVFEPNVRAIRFYERNGYRRDGTTKEEFNSRLWRYEKGLL